MLIPIRLIICFFWYVANSSNRGYQNHVYGTPEFLLKFKKKSYQITDDSSIKSSPIPLFQFTEY